MQRPPPLIPSLDLVAESLQLYRENFGLFSGLVAWLLVLYVLTWLVHFVPNAVLADLLLVVLFVIQCVFSVWLAIVLLLIARDAIARETPDLPQAEAEASRLLLPLVWVAILETLIILGGLVLFIIPGLVFAVWYSFAQLAVIFDEKRGFEALTFSKQLVAGRFMRVVWRLIVGPGVILAIYLAVVIVAVTTISIIGRFREEFFASDTFVMWVDLISSVLEVFFLPWLIFYGALLYENLAGHVWLKQQ